MYSLQKALSHLICTLTWGEKKFILYRWGNWDSEGLPFLKKTLNPDFFLLFLGEGGVGETLPVRFVLILYNENIVQKKKEK